MLILILANSSSISRTRLPQLSYASFDCDSLTLYPRLTFHFNRLSSDAMRMGPGKHLHGLTLPGGLKGEDFDYFHELVVVQELSRIGAPGYMAGKLFLSLSRDL